MEILQSYSKDASFSQMPCAVCIGNFDGGHLGHQALTSICLELAKAKGIKSLALTFFPSPAEFFRGGGSENRLFTPQQKQQFFAELGFSAYLSQNFTKEFSEIEAEAFCSDFLKGFLNAKAVVVGENFRFGRKRGGDVKTLKKFCQSEGIYLHVVSGVSEGEEWISSTRIRSCLKDPTAFTHIKRLLGRPFQLVGQIERNLRIGSKIGFATANLTKVQQALPPIGVYAGFAAFTANGEKAPSILSVDSRAFDAVFSIGYAPTFVDPTKDPKPLKIEAHVIDPRFSPRDLYGQSATFYLCEFLRGEERFSSVPELVAKIKEDIELAKNILPHHRLPS